MKTDERVKLTKEQVESLLPVGDNIHTFMQGGFTLIGCDWSRKDLLKEAVEFSAELAGEQATAMSHGIVITGRSTGRLFVATDKAKLEAFTSTNV